MIAPLVLAVSLGLLATATPDVAAIVPDPRGLVAPFLRARDDHLVGEVVIRALGDAARPTMAPVAYEGISVMLMPYSSELEAELDTIKAHYRDSLKRYMDAMADVTEARAGYERALLPAGGGELIRGEVTDARGVARLAGLPTGEWLLLAWRSQPQPAKPPKLRKEDTTAFRELAVSGGYSIITCWLMRLSLRSGTSTEVELNDRNVWLTGVREDLRVIEGTPKTTGPKNRR